ncbi:MAG: 3-hydroxyacyl-ACP dehydratase FabZ [Candidatus Omnitrophota bacterium]
MSAKFRSTANSAGYTSMDVQQIMEVIPHRYPFLLVDRITELEAGKRAVGIKNVTANENFFTGHFPQRPIMPGVLMVEAMAQVSGLLLKSIDHHADHVGLFMSINNVKFRRPVVPGDQLVMEVEVTRDRSRMSGTHGVARVDGDVACEGDLTFSFMESKFLD